MNNVLAIKLSSTSLESLLLAAYLAGFEVGDGQVKTKNLFLTFNSFGWVNSFESKSRFDILFASVRFSDSKGEFVVVVNEAVDPEVQFMGEDATLKARVEAQIKDGLNHGEETRKYREAAEAEASAYAAKVAEATEAILLETSSAWADSWYFAEQEVADFWVSHKVGNRLVEWSVVYVSGKRTENFEASKVATSLGLAGMWQVYVSRVEKPLETSE